MTINLTSMQESILAFCKSGKTTKSIAEHFNCTTAKVYGNVSLLQRLGLMKRIGFGSRGMVAVYVSAEDYTTGEARSFGRSDHSEFIKRAHDPFNLSGQFVPISTFQNDTL